MAYVIREGDPTTTGGTVIAGSSTTIVEYRNAARITDPVWCPVCQSVGYIAQGHNTWLDNQQAIAVEGCAVQCGCPLGSNRLIATQSSVLSDNQPPVPVPAALVAQVVANTHQWAEAIRLGHPQNPFADSLPREQVKGLAPISETALSEDAQLSQQSVEPGFYIVQTPMSRAALEVVLFGRPDAALLEKFRRLNPQLADTAKPGQMVVLSHPENHQCTREEALLMDAAEKVSAALETFTLEEAAFMVRYRQQIESVLSYGSINLGIATTAAGNHLDGIKKTLQDIEFLHQTYFLRDGHLRSVEFFAERRTLFARLDTNLTSITKMSIAFPDHPDLKTALGISSRSLVHHWTKAGAVGQIPGYATHIEGVSKASKVLMYGGWIGTALGGGASYVRVQDVCSAGNKRVCEKVKFTEVGSFVGGVFGGAVSGSALTLASGSICAAVAVPTGGVGGVICGLVVIGAGSYLAGRGGGAFGELLGENIYEIGQ